MAEEIFRSTITGAVQTNDGTYLTRPADDELYQAILDGHFSYILASRQIGKSSLIHETSIRLIQARIQTAIIDLSPVKLTDEAKWYFTLISKLARELGLQIDIETWWHSQPDLLAFSQRFLEFLQHIVLTEIEEKVVIFFDEIDSTLNIDFTANFFAAIRAIHNERSRYPDSRRLTFVLSGVATPDELINDPTRTPFNIGQRIELNDFTKAECKKLHLAIKNLHPQHGSQYFDEIFNWTKGHPYLTQKLGDAVLQLPRDADPDLVEKLINTFFLEPVDTKDSNIQFVQERFTNNPHVLEMLRIYKQVLQQFEPALDNKQSLTINWLKLCGLIVTEQGKLQIRNKLYATVFDQAWADEMSSTFSLGIPLRYQIIQTLGQGAYATVYLAKIKIEDEEQTVALKVLDLPSESREKQEERIIRFKQEADTLRKLKHRNIISIFETERSETGHEDRKSYYIAMKYISGGSLRKRLDAELLGWREAINITTQIGAALIHAHEKEIIHRDVNTNNILLDTELDPVQAILTDFGIVKLLQHSQYKTVAPVGTPLYMAPEQFNEDIPPTPAMDIYALGLTLFEMLAGERPKKQPNGSFTTLSTMMPEIGPFFDNTLTKATALDATARFQSVAEFIAALREVKDKIEEKEQLQDEASRLFEIAKNYLTTGNYKPATALVMIDEALEIFPDYPEALKLRQEILLEQRLITLSDNAKQALRRHAFQEAFNLYVQMEQTLNETPLNEGYIEEYILEKWEMTVKDIANFFQAQEPREFILTNSQNNIDQNLLALTQLLDLIEASGDTLIAKPLRNILDRLTIERSKTLIVTEEQLIKQVSVSNNFNDTIFDYYERIDQAYQALIELEPENQRWTTSRKEKLREQTELRLDFAERAMKENSDYEIALRHFQAIYRIEQLGYPDLSKDFNLDLGNKIKNIQRNIDLNKAYLKIRTLIRDKKLEEALRKLTDSFISQGIYDYENVALLLWVLTYAQQHEGQYPFDLDDHLGMEGLGDLAMDAERERINRMQITLQSWSNLSEEINEHRHFLSVSNQVFTNLSAQLNRIAKRKASINFENYSQKLQLIEESLSEYQDLLEKIQTDLTLHHIEMWLQTVSPIKDEMDQRHRQEERLELFKQNHDQLGEIEDDPLFELLQKTAQANAGIKQSLAEVQSGLYEPFGKFQRKEKIIFALWVIIVAAPLYGIIWALLR